MRIVFMGSAPLACACLRALLDAHADEVAGVVCQPDRPKGRHLKLAACPVGEMVRSMGLPVLTPERVNTPDSIAAIRGLAPDLLTVVAYGQILKKDLLELPPLGCVNIHASLLPQYRGAAPIQWSIACGERETGVTAMYMNERMDAGDMLLQRRIPIGPSDTAGALHDALAREGALALVDVVSRLRGGRLHGEPQDESKATYAPKLEREDGRIDWTLSA
jgi:methionyl-tRNA formyltransferase